MSMKKIKILWTALAKTVTSLLNFIRDVLAFQYYSYPDMEKWEEDERKGD